MDDRHDEHHRRGAAGRRRIPARALRPGLVD
jgi:hypothetical protein